MAKLSRKFKAVVLGIVSVVGMAACTKSENIDAKTLQEIQQYLPTPSSVDNAGVEPNDPALKGYWVLYGEASSLDDLNHDRRLESLDGLPVYSVSMSVPDSILESSQANKMMLDFMSACIGTENVLPIIQMGEGKIIIYATSEKLQNTFEITHVNKGQKGFTRDASFGCGDKDRANAAVSALKDSVVKYNK